jgi:hypothetical protein
MQPYGMFGPVREHLAKKLTQRPEQDIRRRTPSPCCAPAQVPNGEVRLV